MHAPRLVSVTTVGSRFPEHANAAAFVLGPTGLGLGADGTLYVAETQDSSIHAIRAALNRGGGGTGQQITQGLPLNQPLGLAIAPNGDILTVNGGDGNIVETTPKGARVASMQITDNGVGALFGLAVLPDAGGVYFVDDVANFLNLLQKRVAGSRGCRPVASGGPPGRHPSTPSRRPRQCRAAQLPPPGARPASARAS